jgi:release factor glutamine methyltransferase
LSAFGDRLRAWSGLYRTRKVELDTHHLQIPPGVLDPVLFRSGAVLSQFMRDQVQPGEHVLDLGCGSGVVGVLCKSVGARVCCTDIDPRACDAARSNGIDDVRQGSLFEPVEALRFDHIAFNPPYLRGDPASHPLGGALYGGAELDLVRQFLVEVTEYLHPRGRAWLILSSLEPDAATLLGSAWTLQTETEIQDEVLSIYGYQA